MARRVTTTHKTVATIAAWLVALILFFPILYAIITSLKPRARRRPGSA